MTNCYQWKTAISVKEFALDDLKAYKAAGIDAIEMSLRFTEWDLVDWQQLKRDADEAGIELWSIHLPFSRETDPSTPDEPLRAYSIRRDCAIMKNAASIGIKIAVVHPSAEPIEDSKRPLYMAQSKKSVKELCDCAEQLGMTIAYEDLPRTCLGNTGAEMEELCNCDDRLRVCFDCNHLLYSTLEDFVERVGKKIVTLHLSDYDFTDERHLFPGDGKIDWKALMEMLESVDYNGPFLYECGVEKRPGYSDPDAPERTLADYRKAHMKIKEL